MYCSPTRHHTKWEKHYPGLHGLHPNRMEPKDNVDKKNVAEVAKSYIQCRKTKVLLYDIVPVTLEKV